MGMVVRTNTMAMNANRQLSMNNSQVAKSLEKLSSGFRINRAADDASGLAISEKMKAQIKGLEQASANSQDGISLIQTAEGGLTEVHNMLNRMVELATKSANGTIRDDVDREAIQTEVDALNTEITRISKATNFNGINLLDGTLGGGAAGGVATINGQDLTVTGLQPGVSVKFAVAQATGAGDAGKIAVVKNGNEYTVTVGTGWDGAAAESTDVKLSDIQDALANAGATGAKITNSDGSDKFATGAAAIAGAAGTTANIEKLTAASVNGTAAPKTGYTINFQAGKTGLTSLAITAGAAEAVSTPTTAAGTLTLDQNKFYTASEVNEMLSQAGAKYTVNFSGRQSAADIAAGFDMGDAAHGAIKDGTGVSGSGTGLTLQIGDTNDEFNKVTVSVDDMSASGIGTAGLDVSNQDSAGDAIDVIKSAINKVSTNRANLGALQNRLEYTINNLDTTAENMNAANSRIRDTDMAKEMMNYTKMNILTQAAQAMLAQANQQPQAILQLLQ